MDLRKIQKLIELLEKSALNEIEISEGDSSIRLVRARPSAPQAAPPAPPP
ncbi:MAG: acetyl-CoA carboxylase biotin carboxyl carrier protein, partial [Gammaproteobacteria bacterium]